LAPRLGAARPQIVASPSVDDRTIDGKARQGLGPTWRSSWRFFF
jgi:hypothetical protein